MKLEIDFDSKTIKVLDIKHYIELEKQMKQLFGDGRINWKIVFSEESEKYVDLTPVFPKSTDYKDNIFRDLATQEALE